MNQALKWHHPLENISEYIQSARESKAFKHNINIPDPDYESVVWISKY